MKTEDGWEGRRVGGREGGWVSSTVCCWRGGCCDVLSSVSLVHAYIRLDQCRPLGGRRQPGQVMLMTKAFDM